MGQVQLLPFCAWKETEVQRGGLQDTANSRHGDSETGTVPQVFPFLSLPLWTSPLSFKVGSSSVGVSRCGDRLDVRPEIQPGSATHLLCDLEQVTYLL